MIHSSKIEIGSLFIDHFGLNPDYTFYAIFTLAIIYRMHIQEKSKFLRRDEFSQWTHIDINRLKNQIFLSVVSNFFEKKGRRSMKSLRFRMNARDSRSKKQSCNNVSNPRKQRRIHIRALFEKKLGHGMDRSIDRRSAIMTRWIWKRKT